MTKKTRLKLYYPNYFGDDLIAYVSLRIAMHCNNQRVQADVMGLSSDSSVIEFKKRKQLCPRTDSESPVKHRVYKDAIPSGLPWALMRRFLNLNQLYSISEQRFFHSLRRGDIAYLWPGASLSLYSKLKASGYCIVTERINTLLSNSKRVLDAEYAVLGLPLTHGLTSEAVDEELRCINISDYIFSPSPGVTASILEAGIPRSKILDSSYGLESTEIYDPPRYRPENKPVTAIFVGTICVRKGIHLLLQAWEKANMTGRLNIVGRVSPEARDMLTAALRRRPEIKHIDFVDDLEPIYRDADFLILPSLEEGSPLVSYLALGASLPLVVSPMGSGGIVENMVDGMIVDPHDIDALAGAIRTMSTDYDLRKKMSEAARAKAPLFTWDQVAHRRRDLLLSRLGSRVAV